MHLPQELIDAIVVQIPRINTLGTILRLLRASPAVFSPQICLILHHEPAYLISEKSYHRLGEILNLSPSVLANVWHLKIEFFPTSDRLPERSSLPTILGACTGLRSLYLDRVKWLTPSPEYHNRRAVYRAMQLPTLEMLHLESIQFPRKAMAELAALHMPPRLKTIHVCQVELLYEEHISAQPSATQSGWPSEMTTLVCDLESLPFVRLLYRERPFGNLRELEVNLGGWASGTQVQELLSANPHMERLTLRCGYFPLPSYNLSNNVELRSISIRSNVLSETWCPTGVAELLETLPDAGTHHLAHFELSGIIDSARSREADDAWRAMDATLCRFDMLRAVDVHLNIVRTGHVDVVGLASMSAWKARRLSELQGFLGKTHERGILKITSDA
ncbi:hypothetical protein K523DRAFT_374652 [Schizophyllum commune Tattone D]|nr:hypothetical protein K523DRAFT_374652 [Schizophyllum commune Tattone D]